MARASSSSAVDAELDNTRLLITDLNGVLCRKHPKGEGPLPSGWVESKSYWIEPRPGAKDFISYCLEKWNMAVWSSTTYPNSQPMVDALFTEEQKRRLVFVWYRDRTRLDPEFSDKPHIQSFDTVKNLEDVYSHPFFDRKWTKRNTIIIDDSPTKTRFNPPANVFLIRSFEGQTEENPFETLKVTLDFQCLELAETGKP